MTAQSPAAAAPKPRRPSPTIEIEAVRRAKRRVALWTLFVPTIGTAAALALIPVTGLGALELGLLAAMYAVTIAGVEVGLHRHFSHRAFEAPRAVRVLLAIAGSMAAQGGLSYWVATHRRHHIHSDTVDDPHSPYVRKGREGREERMNRLRGLWHAHVANMYTGHATNVTLFARDLTRDRTFAWIDRHYRDWVVLGVILPGVAGGLISGTWMGALSGLLWGGLVRLFTAHQLYWGNGSFAHMYGPRPFDNGDRSTNNLLFGIPTFGASYQNNHHAFPSSALLGFERHQIDLGAMIIRLLARLRLAWNVQYPTADEIEARRCAAGTRA